MRQDDRISNDHVNGVTGHLDWQFRIVKILEAGGDDFACVHPAEVNGWSDGFVTKKDTPVKNHLHFPRLFVVTTNYHWRSSLTVIVVFEMNPIEPCDRIG